LLDVGSIGLTRAELELRRERYLVRGRWSKADVWVTSLRGGRRVVVKDFAHKSLIGRVWGCLQVWREARLLVLLGDMRAVPALIARLGALALVIEYVDCVPLFWCSEPERAQGCLAQLEDILEEMRRRGVIHNDLRSRENIQLAPAQGRVILLDWAGGVCLRPGSWAYRWLYPSLRVADTAACLKWKQLLRPDQISDQDRRFLRRFRVLRVLWPFNRKGLGAFAPRCAAASRGEASCSSSDQFTK